MEFKNWMKRRVGWKNKPKIVIKHRERRKGKWIECECECVCKDPSRWTDNLCIPCFKGIHKSNIGVRRTNK